jgi:hypothetical protein
MRIEVAPVGQTGEAVQGGELLEPFALDPQIALAHRQPPGHAVERSRQRHEFVRPGARGGTEREIAATEPLSEVREAADRSQDCVLAEEPDADQDQRRGERQLQVGERKVVLDLAQGLTLVEADQQVRTCIGNRTEAPNAAHTIEADPGGNAARARAHLAPERMGVQLAADPRVAVGMTGQYRAVGIDQQHDRAGAVLDHVRQLADPAQVDQGDDHGLDRAMGIALGESTRDGRLAAGAREEEAADDKIPGGGRLAHERPVRDVEPDRLRIG